MGEEKKPLADLIKETEPKEFNPKEQEGAPLLPKKGKNNIFMAIVFVLLLFIIGVGGYYYIYTQYVAKQEVEEEIEEETLVVEEKIGEEFENYVEILEVLEGDYDEKEGSCWGCKDESCWGCKADVKVVYQDGGEVKEIIARGLNFYNRFSPAPLVIEHNYSELGITYLLLYYGSSGTYILNENGYVSESFCSTKYGLVPNEILWDDNHLIYQDCGEGYGYHTELAYGISVLNLESGKITSVVAPFVGSQEEEEISYTIKSVDRETGILYVEESRMSANGTEYEKKEVDLLQLGILEL